MCRPTQPDREASAERGLLLCVCAGRCGHAVVVDRELYVFSRSPAPANTSAIRPWTDCPP